MKRPRLDTEEGVRDALEDSILACSRLVRNQEAKARAALIKLLVAAIDDYARLPKATKRAAENATRELSAAIELRRQLTEARATAKRARMKR